MWPSLSRITPLPPPEEEPFEATMVTVEGQDLLRGFCYALPRWRVADIELTEPREGSAEELLFDAAMPPPTPAPNAAANGAARRAAVSTTPAP